MWIYSYEIHYEDVDSTIITDADVIEVKECVVAIHGPSVVCTDVEECGGTGTWICHVHRKGPVGNPVGRVLGTITLKREIGRLVPPQIVFT